MKIQKLRFDYDAEYQEACRDAIPVLNQEIDSILNENPKESFLYSPPASRNIHSSQLYSLVTDLIFLEKIALTRKVEVAVESVALANLLKATKKIKVRILWASVLKSYLRSFALFFLHAIKLIRLWKFAKTNSLKFEQLRHRKDLIVVDTYLTDFSFSSGKYNDRYFGEFFNHFTDDELSRTILWGSLVAITDFRKLNVALNQIKNQMVFLKESTLKFIDVLRILYSVFNIMRLKGVDTSVSLIGALVKEDAFKMGSHYMTFEALASSVAFRKFVAENLDIQTFINWHENHLYDRALVYEYSKLQKPEFLLKSYQCCLQTESEFFIQPTPGEHKAHLVPQILFYAGADHLKNINFLGSIFYKRTALFRMQKHLRFLKENLNIKRENVALVALPMNANLARDILEFVQKLAPSLQEIEFRIRFHPMTKLDFHPTANIVLDATSDSVEALQKSRYLISSASSICFEARCLGVKTFIFRKPGSPPTNPVPKELRENWVFDLCYYSEPELNRIKSIFKTTDQAFSQNVAFEYIKLADRSAVEKILSKSIT